MVTRHTDNRLALGRLGALVEQLHALVRSGRQVILVTSGAVCVGRQVLRQQQVLNSSPLQMMGNHNFCGAPGPGLSTLVRAAAMAGLRSACGPSNQRASPASRMFGDAAGGSGDSWHDELTVSVHADATVVFGGCLQRGRRRRQGRRASWRCTTACSP